MILLNIFLHFYNLYYNNIHDRENYIIYNFLDYFKNLNEVEYYLIKEDGFDNIRNKKEFIKFVNCVKKEILRK